MLDHLSAAALSPEATPRRIRLSLIEKYGLPPLGSRISLRARIAPVAGAVVPGGYDAHRAAFFDGIGGSGFVLGKWTLESAPATYSYDLIVAEIRAAIVQRIMAAQPGEAGAVAAALLVGERSALSPETNDSLRISGLFHILSISGLHMMLIAGTTFLVVRALLALSPALALRRPIRKWAALAALLVLTAYFALSGGGAATVRSYVMALIIFGAMLVDRPAISMRNLAIAAFIVLAMEPEGVVEPSFQMSFAAVAALIAGWEFWRGHRAPRLADDNVIPGFRILRHRRDGHCRCGDHDVDRRLRHRALRRLSFRARRDLFAARQPARRSARLGHHHAVRVAVARTDAVRPRSAAARRHGLGDRDAACGLPLRRLAARRAGECAADRSTLA